MTDRQYTYNVTVTADIKITSPTPLTEDQVERVLELQLSMDQCDCSKVSHQVDQMAMQSMVRIQRRAEQVAP